MDHFEKNNNHCEAKNEYMNKRQAAKQVWKLTREFNYCDLNREKIRASFFLFSLVWIHWVALDKTYISFKILSFDIWDALKPMYASKLSYVTGYWTVFHYHEATPVNIHR